MGKSYFISRSIGLFLSLANRNTIFVFYTGLSYSIAVYWRVVFDHPNALYDHPMVTVGRTYKAVHPRQVVGSERVDHIN